jgi:excisionase family DNA binding protein
MTDKPQTLDRDWMTAQQAADYLQVEVQTVRRMVVAGKLKGTKLGSGKTSPLRISASSIEKLLESNKH